MRRAYPLRFMVNGVVIRRVVVDDHYEKKHGTSINDSLILALVRTLDEGDYLPNMETAEGFQYFRNDPIFHQGKAYRLIWLLPPGKSYLGVINAFRRKR